MERSSYYDYRSRKKRINVQRVKLKALVNRIFTEARSSVGSRGIRSILADEGVNAGRYLIRRLMKESGLICKQPGPHKYKRASVEHVEIPNRLNRQFEVAAPNKVWCGDITYIWTGRRWAYLAVVMDLYARRVIGWAMSKEPIKNW